MQAIIDAYAQDPRIPKWTIARHFRCAHGMDDGVDPSLRAAVHRRVREANEVNTRTRIHPLVAKVAAAKGTMSPLEQAESVGRGSASCSRPGAGGGLYPIPLLRQKPLGRGDRVRQRRGSVCAKIHTTNDALNSLASFKRDFGEIDHK